MFLRRYRISGVVADALGYSESDIMYSGAKMGDLDVLRQDALV